MKTLMITTLALATTLSFELHAEVPVEQPTFNYQKLEVDYSKQKKGKANNKTLSANVLPDITSKGINIPKATGTSNNKILKASDAKTFKNGKCVYDIGYSSVNTGKVKAGAHGNTLKHNGKAVTSHYLTLQPGQSRQFNFQVSLSEGNNNLQLQLDVGNKINESKENNNLLTKNYKVIGSCKNLVIKK